jgi:hypothetical protein
VFPPFLALVLAAALAASCTSDNRDSRAAVVAEPSPIEWFVDRARESGLEFTHFNGLSGRFYQPEIMAPGVGLFDYDNDGDLDIYLVQGRLLGPDPQVRPKPDTTSYEDRLYRNDLEVKPDGTRTLRFTDVSERSGIRTRGYGMGVAAGDIDNDGDIDLYVTGFRRNQMFRNNGDGTFTDVSRPSGTDDPLSWGVSAAFVDVDRDGWLDLFVGNYLQYTFASHIDCVGVSGLADYCRPSAYRPQPSRLYRNRGGGRFENVTIASGLARQYGPALGVATADFNADGWVDIFVANDEQENQLWINQRDGTFTNTALQAGAALGPAGERKANMGVDAGDFDADGDEDLFITELIGQGSTLYVNDGSGMFEEQSGTAGIRRPSLPYTGFGTAWFDYDNDGWLDLLAVNGEVNRTVEMLARTDDPFPMGQRKQLFRNISGRFEDVTGRAGKVFELVEAGRGAAFGDVDNDGDTDVLVGNGAGPVRLLINQIGSRNSWVGLRLAGRPPGAPGGAARDMIGTRVGVVRAGHPVLWRRARSDGSYASANDPRVLAGLGGVTEAVRVRVIWPDGAVEEWADISTGRYTTLTRGEGSVAK